MCYVDAFSHNYKESEGLKQARSRGRILGLSPFNVIWKNCEINVLFMNWDCGEGWNNTQKLDANFFVRF